MQTAFKQPDGTVKWVNYQNLPGMAGERKVEDRQKFIEEDFKNARVLDLGCWGGQMMLEAKRLGAKEVVGVEIDKNIIGKGRELGNEIIYDDLENPFFWKKMPRFDVVLCLAILGNMRNQIAAISNAAQLADVMYVEGHGVQHKFSKTDWVNLFLTYTTYKTIEHLGEVQTRPFFRLSREERTLDYILAKNYKRIALIGKPGAGKTHLTKSFNAYKIYTDREDANNFVGDKILVDNHGALKLTNFDCVINVIADRKTRVERIAQRPEASGVEINKIEEFADKLSSHYMAGEYDYFTITNK